MRDKSESGFTILEILIVIGLLVLVLSFTLPFALSQIQKSNLKTEMESMKSATFSQQQNAYTRLNESAYGVKFLSDGYVLFAGDSYATANNTEIIELPNNVRITNITLGGGGDEIVFKQGEIQPNSEGTITLTGDSASYILSINKEGLIEYSR